MCNWISTTHYELNDLQYYADMRNRMFNLKHFSMEWTHFPDEPVDEKRRSEKKGICMAWHDAYIYTHYT